MADLPREELLRRADIIIKSFRESNVEAIVRFKFTCGKCGTRCTLQEANVLPENGECFHCGAITKLGQGGFMLEAKLGEGT